jgi:hypothetical protein
MEYWSTGVMDKRKGIMEEWNVGMKEHDLKGSLPILQHSNTPVLHWFITPTLQYSNTPSLFSSEPANSPGTFDA